MRLFGTKKELNDNSEGAKKIELRPLNIKKFKGRCK